MDPEPPQPELLLSWVTLVPAIVAAAYSIVGTTVASLSLSRIAAIREALTGGRRLAVERFVENQDKIQTRWIVFRVAGIAMTASLLSEQWSGSHSFAWALAWVASVAAYALPSELLRPYAASRAEELVPFLLRWAKPGEWLVAPIADPLHWVGGRFPGRLDAREPSPTLTETEVEFLVNESELNGSLAHDQSEMIRNVLDFGEVTAEELMVPRTQVDGLDSELTWEEALSEVTRTAHSRYPVYTDTMDNVAGVLHVKDLFHAMAHGALPTKSSAPPRESIRPGLSAPSSSTPNAPTRLLDLARKPVAFVPEGQLASTVLRDMRAGRHHMAVVLDEFGGVAGILTLEDLLEEIVGDIQDEHDLDDATRIRMLSAHTALVHASMPVSDINRMIGTELPDGDYVSLGGLLLEHLGTVPAQGSTHHVFGLKIVIREADARHIAQVELSEVPGAPRGPSTRPPASAA